MQLRLWKETKVCLEIKTEERNNECVVIIEDNGIGMSNEQLKSLFEPFYTGKKGGMGLGLTATQKHNTCS